MTTNKPLPGPDVESQPYWDACREHVLKMQHCSNCEHLQFPAATFCEKCRSSDLDWKQVSGKGSVFSWIVVRHPIPREIFGDVVPYAVGLIALDEGPRIASNIIACDVDDIVDGMPVEVVFDDVTEGVSLPKFRPARATAA